MPITNIPSTPATLARDMPGADIRPFDIPAAWDAATLQHDDSWIIRLTDAERDELDAALAFFKDAADARGRREFEALLGERFGIGLLPGHDGWVGGEVSPFSREALGIRYPRLDVDTAFAAARPGLLDPFDPADDPQNAAAADTLPVRRRGDALVARVPGPGGTATVVVQALPAGMAQRAVGFVVALVGVAHLRDCQQNGRERVLHFVRDA